MQNNTEPQAWRAKFSLNQTGLHISQLVFWSGLAFLTGVAQVSIVWIWVGCVLILTWYRWQARHWVQWLHIGWAQCLLVMVLWLGCWAVGAIRYVTYLPDTSSVPYEQEVDLTGYISRPPVMTHEAQKIYVATDDLPGKVYIKVGLHPEYTYGQEVQVHCTLRKPEPFDTFAFDKYLARYGVLSICQQAQVRVTGAEHGNAVYRALYTVRNWFQVEIRRLWPEPVSSLILGVVLGIQDDIPDDIVEQFRATGTIHILVVSGMHVMIIAQLLSKILERWLRPRAQFAVIAIALFGFCVIIGLAASVVRASLMGLLPILARAVQRRPVMHYSLAITAVGMVAWNPYILLHDMGFQLSFLATLGLIYLQPLCARLCWWVPERFTLRETLSTTMAATLFTTPLTMSTFGMFSTFSLLANVIVVPISNLMLFVGFGCVMLAQVSVSLAGVVGYLLWVVVSGMLWVIQWMSAQPYALLENVTVPNWLPVVAYLIIVAYVLWNTQSNRSSTGASMSSGASSSVPSVLA